MDLLPGGSSTPVTNETRSLYCHLLSDFHLNQRCASAGGNSMAFGRGEAPCLPPIVHTPGSTACPSVSQPLTANCCPAPSECANPLPSRLGRPAASFAAGMGRVLPLAALRLFSPSEFNQLLSGGRGGGVDVDDWRGALHLGGRVGGQQGGLNIGW